MNELKEIEELIVRYGMIDGAHHKNWVLDQVMRIIKKDKYEEFVRDYEYKDDDGNILAEKIYEWNPGIAP